MIKTFFSFIFLPQIHFASAPQPLKLGVDSSKSEAPTDMNYEFVKGCREGVVGVTFISVGITTIMTLRPQPSYPDAYYSQPLHYAQNLANFGGEMDFDKEHGKVSFFL